MNHGGPNLSLAFTGILGFAVRDWPAPRLSGWNPPCWLTWPDRGGVHAAPERTTLDDFLAANDGEFSRGDVQAICDALSAGRPYHGGGGASERWTLEAVQ